MKKIVSIIVCLVMFFSICTHKSVYAERQFLKPAFGNGGVMGLDLDGYSYYYINEDSEVFPDQTNNTLIRFDYDSGERVVLAEGVVDFISNGEIVYYVADVAHRNQIWKVNCDGTGKMLIYSLLSNSVRNILYCDSDGFIIYEVSDGTQQRVNVTEKSSAQVNNRDIVEEMRYSYIEHLQYLYSNRSEAAVAYLIYDINKDNIPELITKHGYSEADYSYSVMSYQDGGPKLIGRLPGGHVSLWGVKESGILLYVAHMGYEMIFEGAISNNQLTYKQIYEEDCSHKEYTYDGKVDKFRTGAQKLEVCRDFLDYTLINNYFDAMMNNQNIVVVIDEKEISFDQPPIIVDGRTLVPLRGIFEAMGATVEWNESTKTATGYGKLGYNVTVTEGSDTAYIDGFPYKLDVPVKNYNGRLLAPARFVAEAFGGYVSWDDETKTVKIQSLSTDVSYNRSYDENARYSTCYEAAMTHGRLVYVADGYKTVFLRSGYIDKTGNQYRFVNSQETKDQRYYFDSSNNLVTDYELAKRLDFVYSVNNNDYEARSEHWTEKVNVEDEMNGLKQSFSKSVALLEEGASSLELGYAAYDVGKIFFNQMVLGTICPPYGKEKLKDLPASFAKTTTNLTFDGLLLIGLINSKNDFNGYCDTITKTYNKYGYGYITSLEDAEQYISAISGQCLIIGNADAFAAYLKETYPNMTVVEVLKDLGKEVVTGVVGVFVDGVKFDDEFAVGNKLKKIYTGETEIITYLEGINTGGSIAIAKKGTAAFNEAQNIISKHSTFDKTNAKFIQLIQK